MRIELAERLICPAAHEATPLIVVAHETVERDLRHAQLGCMICFRAGEVREGTVRLGASSSALSTEQALVATDNALLRLAALLGLNEPHSLVLLGARYASFAPVLALHHDAIVAVYDVAGPSPVDVGYVEVTEDVVPFATGTFAAATLDSSMKTGTVADVVRCVRVGGRIVGDSDIEVPPRVRELARDAEGWVGEVEAAASPVISLRRA